MSYSKSPSEKNPVNNASSIVAAQSVHSEKAGVHSTSVPPKYINSKVARNTQGYVVRFGRCCKQSSLLLEPKLTVGHIGQKALSFLTPAPDISQTLEHLKNQ
jgi:hypothetical protein